MGKEEGQKRQEGQREFDIVVGVQRNLLNRFGRYRTSSWQPTRDNILILEDEPFNQKMIEEAEPEGIDPAVVNDLVGYASFGTRSLYVRSTEGRGQAFKQTIAHEILHLWFMRQMLDEGDPASDGVNETFVDTLALEGLRYFHLPRKAREPEIDGAINNSAIIKGVIERLGERGWEGLFRACQSGEQRQIASLMERTFGSQPKRALRQTNDSLQVVFGKNFWGRFKELALMTYLQRSDPTFQAKHRAVDHQMQLIIEWAQIDPKYLRELQ